MPALRPLSQADWLAFCRRAAEAARAAVAGYATIAERSVETGRGEGGDMALVIDRAAEDAIFAELEALDVPVTAIAEERGEVELNGGGETRVVIDPVDGSLNAKRGLPFAAVSIAVAEGPRMDDVIAGCVAEFDPAREWWAARGKGAFRRKQPAWPAAQRPLSDHKQPAWPAAQRSLSDAGKRLGPLAPGPLELLALETARPDALAASAELIGTVGADRVRAFGSVSVTLCLVAAGELDAMISLRDVRSVDAAAAQLIVREAGGAVRFPADDSLGLDMRSPVAAARDAGLLERVLGHFGAG